MNPRNDSEFEGSLTSLESSVVGGSTAGANGGGAKRGTTGVNTTEAANALENTYTIRPNFHLKFRPAAVKEILRTVLYDELNDKEYDTEQAKDWSKQIADIVRQKMKELELDRYKFVVQAGVGEQRGQGIKVATRCLWDSDADSCAQESYLGETMFASVAVYGIFHY